MRHGLIALSISNLMMLRFRHLVIAISAFTAAATCSAEANDDSLLVYAVSINRSATTRSGTGVYLGEGFILTASHVVGRPFLNRTRINIGGQDLTALVSKQDSFENSDLALLTIDDKSLPVRIRLRRISLCAKRPWPGEDVVTVIPEEAVHSRVISPRGLPPQAKRFDTIIRDVAGTGNSGSGVFDAQKGCLVGIMSRKITQTRTINGSQQAFDVAKYFVPASTIAAFLPPDVSLNLKQ